MIKLGKSLKDNLGNGSQNFLSYLLDLRHSLDKDIWTNLDYNLLNIRNNIGANYNGNLWESLDMNVWFNMKDDSNEKE